jgi:hypothetical protein
MPPKTKLHKFCRIFLWIEAQDAQFAGAIRDLCMEGHLSPSPRLTGVTFLYPKEDLRKKIVNLTYGDGEEDPEQAIKILESLILPVKGTTAGELESGPVGSRLGIAYRVTSASQRGVTFEAAGETFSAKPSASFKPLRRDNIAVWELTDGQPPLEGGESFSPPRPERGSGVKRGGAPSSFRAECARQVESRYRQAVVSGKRDTNPYLGCVVSLLKHLEQNQPDKLTALKPLLDRNPVASFYLIVEPYKTSGSFMVEDDTLEAWGGGELYQDAVSEFKQFFEEPAEGAAYATERYYSAVAEARQDVLEKNPKQLVGAVAEKYQTLCRQNKVGDVDGVLPPATLQLLEGDGTKKQWQDEMRHVIHDRFQKLHGSLLDTASDFDDVRSILQQNPGNNYQKELLIVSASMLHKNVKPDTEHRAALSFIQSSDFLYAAQPEQLAHRATASAAEQTGNPAEGYRNVEPTKAEYLESSGKGLKKSTYVDKQAAQQLMQAARSQGVTLPPEVQSLLPAS